MEIQYTAKRHEIPQTKNSPGCCPVEQKKTCERSAKPQLKNATFGHIIVFANYLSYLYRFTVNPGCITRLPLQNGCTKTFYTSTPASAASCLPCVFFCNAPLWYGMVPANATANRSCTVLSQTQKQVLNSVCWKKSRWALTATRSRPFAVQRLRS